MTTRRLEVLKATSHVPALDRAHTTVVDMAEIRTWVKTGAILRRLLRYSDVTLRTSRIDVLTKPFATALVLRSMSRGTCSFKDDAGQVQDISVRQLLRLARAWLVDAVDARSVVSRARDEVRSLEPAPEPRLAQVNPSGRPLYLRSDLFFGLEAGGSLGHIAGVLNSLGRYGREPLFVTSDRIPTVDATVESTVVDPAGRFRDFADLPEIAYNGHFAREVLRVAAREQVSFVYQRYSSYNYAGLLVARTLKVPFVLEYNGSEVWINRNWGKPLRYEELAERIELQNLRGADLVVVVSEVMKDELLGRGIADESVLVNPNGVDPEMYSPGIDGTEVRERLGIGDELVLGFIGTFGRWHGAEKLVQAFSLLLDERPDRRRRVRLLMIGDGIGLPATRQLAGRGSCADRIIFTGQVPQAEGPRHLAACDVLVSPHVPNPDGSRFFGSPTKLYEYMAMGKPIVASGLDQIADVLDDGRTAIVVKPGDIEALATGMARAIDDPQLAARMAGEARRQAVEHHSWNAHTARIIERLEERCA